VGLFVVGLGCSSNEHEPKATTSAELGALLFDDPRLSEPAGQACSDCHAPAMAFADPEDDRTSVGVVPGRFGVRNAQSAMYAGFTPPLHEDPTTGRMAGGLFWDGRANTLEDQAGMPLLNPLEMNNPDKAAVVAKVRAYYGPELRAIHGTDALADVDRAFGHVTAALAAHERSASFAPFSSKYDRFLAGAAQLDEHEARGLAIFEDPARGNCASCHPSRPTADGAPPVFTNFAYENLGVPRFNNNPFYHLDRALNPLGEAHVDRGLGEATKQPKHDGMFRVPTLRNVARTTPYGHNGYFRRLDEIVAFHSPDSAQARDPEVAPTTREHLGSSPLSEQDIADLVAFLRTLTDAEVERAPVPRE
jgi:cytochrome c peroxidase